ncbi:putative PKS-like protein biosynthetic cluster [Neopestalotiopsis sp. 37M]|nr:putative PKS-like protein biosynthetic cluster [Neopestalotiopsis sp. 37M]
MGSTLLLFGPQALSFSVASLQTLRKSLREADDCKWMLDAVYELPTYWNALAEQFPKLEAIPGERLLNDLKHWFQADESEKVTFGLPNLLLTPLVVLTQLTQFSRYMSYSRSGASVQDNDLFRSLAQHRFETVGLCTGLLSASAISSASDVATFREYGAVAVRLAMLVGALVDCQDAQDMLHGSSKSFAVAWTSSDMAKDLAYISVLFDETRATVTTAERTAPLMIQQMRQKGVKAAEVGLRGRFHSQVHHNDLESLFQFCDSDPAFQLPDTSTLTVPINLGKTGTDSKLLHHAVLRMILVEQADWYKTFSGALPARLELAGNDPAIITFGPDKGVPPSLLRKIGPRIVHASDIDQATASLDAVDSALDPAANNTPWTTSQAYENDSDIAVVGMSCQVAGAEDLNEFWKILCAGESQHTEVPEARFGVETQWRDVDPNRKWYGNFIRDHDVFDHKFFKKSPREMTSADPQQRLMLQCAYQAVEQSGYFHQAHVDPKVGCYLGACAADYEHNVACHPANAFTATGNLKSFIPGKISHYFGWTGPGLTIDSACSASAVAVHMACKAILGGECSGALAGGVGLMGNITWFQNLAGASFLSPTGQCKPWDQGADGYCRGEAAAVVFLKRMKDAVADGNQILGCISSTAVYQNENCTPVFVPNSPSLTYLFKDVLERANLKPSDISVVEAHGTGTPVGDPAEYQSVLQALGGTLRDEPLALGSVKGLIGHTEGASGVCSLIKIILMMQHGYIPPQASFHTLAHNIAASPSDKIDIVTKLKPWATNYRAALINNYGASGSNASMVVTQAPRSSQSSPIHAPGIKHPFWFCGLDDRALIAYSAKLREYLANQKSSTSAANISVANLSFNVCRQSNRNLDRGLLFNASSPEELDEKLSAFIKGDAKIASISTKTSARPIVMCFGGQVSNLVGLDKRVYDNVKILRSYLDQCNAVFLSIGLEGIYPSIFQREPIEDTVRLQTLLFAMQYACAKSWMDSGIRLEAVVGHSFGELTALCISGVLSLKDTAKVIAARAKLVKEMWGSDKGAMMAIEADLDMVKSIVETHNLAVADDLPINIACYNGPRSFTLAGSTKSMDKLTKTLTDSPIFSSATRFKRLNVTNAFHSALVEPLMEDLDNIGRSLTFREPSILMERSTEELSMEMTSDFVAQHMRQPVFFDHAVKRLVRQYPDAVWLEAGSASTITNMASRALGSPSTCHFQALNITNDNGMQSLADTTLALWKTGVKSEYWAHHAGQTLEFDHLFLPPYQFEKVKHWMDLKKPLKGMALLQASEKETAEAEVPTGLWSFIGYQDADQRTARFLVNTNGKKYNDFVSGHWIANTAPICPATLEVDMVIEALMSIRPNLQATGMQPCIENMQNHAPICVNPSRQVFIEYEANDVLGYAWKWKITSSPAQGPGATTEHVHGNIVFRSAEDQGYQAEFDRYKRHFTHQRCLNVLNSDEADDIIQGRNIYKTFGEIVDYGEEYRGLKRLVGLGNECAGRVSKRWSGETWLDTHLSDCFSQVGGIWVNCMTNRAPEDMYIANGCDLVMRSPKLRADSPRPEVWDVFATHHQVSEKLYVTDVFTFDGTSGELVEVMIGIKYASVAKASMQKILARLSPGISVTPLPASSVQFATANQEHKVSSGLGTTAPVATSPEVSKVAAAKAPKKSSGPTKADIKKEVRNLLANVAGVEASDISEDTMLADIGIDSLMGMELARETETALKCTLSPDKLMEAFDFPSFVDCVVSALGITIDDQDEEEEEEGLGEDEGDDSESDSKDEQGHSTSVSTPPSSVGGDLDELTLPTGAVLESFSKAKCRTDQMIRDYKLDTFANVIAPKSTQLCIALTLEAFDKLGVSIRTAKPGQVLPRIKYAPQHERLVGYLYRLLENDARLIDTTSSGEQVRTGISPPKKSSTALLQDLVRQYPDWSNAQKLTHFAGSKLADVLEAKTDGIKIIFGNDEGRALVAGLYCDHLFNKLNYQQMADCVEELVSRLPAGQGPLRILELGAGTGGTTLFLAPLLERLQVDVEYTFTDIAPSMVGAAKKKFGKYRFMKFMAHDMEKPVPAELLGSQHIVVASNAVHATRDLVKTGKNIHAALRPDGFLMMLEMTEIVPFVDTIFGLLEGWWLFDDGRQHAIIGPEGWEKAMHAAGFGHTDWTDGHLPESKIQRVIVSMASGHPQERLPISPAVTLKAAEPWSDLPSRERDISAYVKKYSAGFEAPSATSAGSIEDEKLQCVLITGATGSLGTHLVKEFADRADVGSVICLNRQGSSVAVTPEVRQLEAMTSRGVTIDAVARAKLRFIETDSSRARLGLNEEEYAALTRQVTSILHNAWPMSGNRPIKGFEAAFTTLRNLIDLARDAAGLRATYQQKINFQFISSIGVVGHYPLWSGETTVPEERMEPRSVLPNGYCDSKFTCERILDETLHRYPEYFHTMSARLGQVAGSKTSGYWNPVEHFCFLVKSSKNLKVLPRLEGNLTWCPVNDMAAALSELLLLPYRPQPIYHIDNPVPQPWSDMVQMLATELDIPRSNIIPFDDWVARVRRSSLAPEVDNPAARLIDFLEFHFRRMSCGGLLLGLSKACEDSPALAAVGPITEDVIRKYVSSWKAMGFLY